MVIPNPKKWYESLPPKKLDKELKFSVEKFNQKRNGRIISKKTFFVRIWFFITNPITYIIFGYKRY